MTQDSRDDGTPGFPNEAALVQRIRQHDAAAFQDFVDAYLPRVARLALRLTGHHEDAEDVVQEAFATVWRRAGQLRQNDRVWSWLAAITVNQCRTRQRKRLLFWRYTTDALRTHDNRAPPASDKAQQNERDGLVQKAVRALPPKLREVAVLRYLEELEIPQIAEILGVTRNAVEVRLHRARASLERSLEALIKE